MKSALDNIVQNGLGILNLTDKNWFGQFLKMTIISLTRILLKWQIFDEKINSLFINSGFGVIQNGKNRASVQFYILNIKSSNAYINNLTCKCGMTKIYKILE